MKNQPRYNIKSFKGLLRENFYTPFPMIDANWIGKPSKKFKVKSYETFAQASADMQVYFKGQGAEIVAERS